VVSKTIQIRDVSDDVYAALSVRAAEAGLSVPELLRREATRLASRPSVGEWLERLGRRTSDVTSAEVTATLDEIRGPWPDARR
jgi:plasmid stability protein